MFVLQTHIFYSAKKTTRRQREIARPRRPNRTAAKKEKYNGSKIQCRGPRPRNTNLHRLDSQAGERIGDNKHGRDKPPRHRDSSRRPARRAGLLPPHGGLPRNLLRRRKNPRRLFQTRRPPQRKRNSDIETLRQAPSPAISEGLYE